MSDIVLVIALMCITTLGITCVIAISTYRKDKLDFRLKTSVKDIVDNEVSITGTDDKKTKK